MERALVLNASYEALGFVSTRRALVLLIYNKAELIYRTGVTVSTVDKSFPEPSIVRLYNYVRVPYNRKIAITKRAIFIRDNNRCQYCGAAAENIDHVIPKSRGGKNSWDNVVAACKRCNAVKGSNLISEMGLKLYKLPREPQPSLRMFIARGDIRPEWQQYVQGEDRESFALIENCS
ncbi:MAG: HNH endonuclease [Firmicutes bacterium]|jgi:5-methylcytosine-specific restriction endonuclease McrA|nr:HNH endonuclease [Bacillota bacterium]